MQGYWTNATYTPVERPAEFKDQEFFTVAQAQEYAKQAQDRFLSQPDDDPHYDNSIWMVEKGLKGVSTLRTSIVVDPADGRIPPVNAEGKKRADERAAARTPRRRVRLGAEPRHLRALHLLGPRGAAAHADRLQLEPADLAVARRVRGDSRR